jgi:hypothetical protein
VGNRDQHSNKEAKKKPLLNPKEKKAAKIAKKSAKGNSLLEHNSN